MKGIKRFAAVMAVSVACGIFAGGNKKETDSNWQEEAKTSVADKMDETNIGNFYLEGKMYDFPCTVKELLDNGWKFEDESKASEQIGAYGWYPNIITLENDKNKEITIGVYNESGETMSLSDCKTGELTLNKYLNAAMFSGEMEFRETVLSAKDDIYNYTAEGFEFDQVDDITATNYAFTKNFTSKDGFSCTSKINLEGADNGLVISQVQYRCDFTVSYVEAIIALSNATMNNDASLAKDVDPRLNADETVDTIRNLVAGDFIYSSGFSIPEPTEAELNKVYSIMDYIYGKTSCDYSAKPTETIATYTAPNNLPDVINNAVADAAANYEGDTETAFSDPAFFDLFLDAFISRESELTIVGGPSLIISNDDYVNGVYDLLYGMLGFYDLL